MRSYQIGDAEIDRLVAELVAAAGGGANTDLIEDPISDQALHDRKHGRRQGVARLRRKHDLALTFERERNSTSQDRHVEMVFRQVIPPPFTRRR